jgi:transcriptional regulator with XRE-family HTH domain
VARQREGIKKFGERVRQLRLDRKVSQEDLAFKCGLEFSQISRIERGIINTSISHAFTIAKALDLEPYLLFKFE